MGAISCSEERSNHKHEPMSCTKSLCASAGKLRQGEAVIKPPTKHFRTWNLLVELLPPELVNEVFQYLIAEPAFWTRRPKQPLHDKFHSFPRNIWIERASDREDQPSLVLTIGAPGTGKTTWATSRYRNVYAADDWYQIYRGGKFDHRLIHKAHAWCKQQVIGKLKENATVCAGNTNTQLREMYPYVAAVVFGNLPQKIVFARMPDQSTDVLFKRNVHNVPSQVIETMRTRLEKMGRPTIDRVLAQGPFPEFKKNASKRVLFLGIFFDKQTQKQILDYTQSLLQTKLLPRTVACHATTQFKPTDADVQDAPLGEEFEVTIVGIASNPYCTCLSVKLTGKGAKLKTTNKHLHITVATRPNIPPVTSNFVLQHQPHSTTSPFVRFLVKEKKIKGRMGAFIHPGVSKLNFNPCSTMDRDKHKLAYSHKELDEMAPEATRTPALGTALPTPVAPRPPVENRPKPVPTPAPVEELKNQEDDDVDSRGSLLSPEPDEACPLVQTGDNVLLSPPSPPSREGPRPLSSFGWTPLARSVASEENKPSISNNVELEPPELDTPLQEAAVTKLPSPQFGAKLAVSDKNGGSLAMPQAGVRERSGASTSTNQNSDDTGTSAAGRSSAEPPTMVPT